MSWMNCRAGALARLLARLIAPLALVALWGIGTTPARAWGVQGHQVVAAIAWQGLSPVAREEATRLLAPEPGQTLVSISTWADEHRGPASAPWHYLNFPRGQCRFDAARDCPDGQCVVGAIERQRAILASKATDAERLQALKYLVHFVADIHQPLHAGYQDDRGGNTVQLRFLMRGSNLHALWDKGLIEQLGLDNEALIAAAHAQLAPQGTNQMQVQTHAQPHGQTQALPKAQSTAPAPPGSGLANAIAMAEESCRIVAQPGFYPQGDPSPAYVARMTPVLLQRLALAGQRLAALLNQALP